jgi:DNA polymerase-1
MSLCAQLFANANNTLQATSTGFTCGHEPCHTSKSNTCITIDSSKDVWYCCSCMKGGGPVQAAMDLQGLAKAEADALVQAMGGTVPTRAGSPGNKESLHAAALAIDYQDVLAYDGATQRWLAYSASTPGIWSPLDAVAPEDSALQRIHRDLAELRPDGYSWNFCRGVERFLRLECLTRFPACPADRLPVLNGLLDLRTRRVESYTPAQHITWCVPFPWEATATCPATLTWLQDATQHDHGVLAVLRAYLKAILLGRTDLHRFVELIGPGGSGKGTFIRLATALVGRSNAYATELRRLEQSRFETANLRGKRLICITDAERYGGEVNVLKALTGGDELPFEEKFKPGRNGHADGLVLIGSNEAIMSADYTSGLARRRITIPFLHQPPQRTDLLSFHGEALQGTLVDELPGVLRWVLTLPDERMEALLRQTPVEVQSLARTQAQNLVATNPLAHWADTALLSAPIPDDKGTLPKTYVGEARRYQPKEAPATYENCDTWLYANYRDFTDAVGNKPISMRRFSSLLEDLCRHQLHLAHVEHTRDNHGAYFTGVRLRPVDNVDSPRLITRDSLASDGSAPAGDGSVTDQIYVDAGSDGCDGCVHARDRKEPYAETTAPKKCDGAVDEGVLLQRGGSAEPSHPSLPALNEENQTLNPSLDPSLSVTDPSLSVTGPFPTSQTTITVGPTLDLPEVEYVTTASRLAAVLLDLAACPRLGFDIETTGLDPRTAQIRLLQFATPSRVVLVDAYQCPLPLLAPLLHSPAQFVGHNLKFELHFLAAAGLPWPADLLDTQVLAQLVGASAQKGARPSYALEHVVDRTLGLVLDKTEQKSDWSGTLRPAQITYAATDAAVMFPLAAALVDALHTANLEQVSQLEHACLPAVVWMEQAGVPIDQDRWRALAGYQTHTAAKYLAELHALHGQGQHGHTALFPEMVNWRSTQQVQAVLQARGHSVTSTASEVLAPLAADPLIALLLAYKEADKRAGTYGEKWLKKHLHPISGRVHADYFQLGSVAGRLSCGRPNMQNIPRQSDYRACFRAADGQCFIKADYSQIELRIAAVMAQDTAMLAAFQAGADIHAVTAARLLGIPVADVTTEARQMAKAVNFGLLYGMGALRLQEYAQQEYHVPLTVEEAHAHRQAFFQLYPGIRQWHTATGAVLRYEGAIDTRTLTNRRRLAVTQFTDALNTPVQGTGADGLKAAMAALWQHRAEAPEARLIACIHDELVVECPVEQAEATAQWVQRHMETAMAAIVAGGVPIAAETTIGQDWAGTPLTPASTIA